MPSNWLCTCDQSTNKAAYVDDALELASTPPRLPHLELLFFRCVVVSESVLAGCPALETLVLDECIGLAQVRISSGSIKSVAVSVVHLGRRFYPPEATVLVWKPWSPSETGPANIVHHHLIGATNSPWSYGSSAPPG